MKFQRKVLCRLKILLSLILLVQKSFKYNFQCEFESWDIHLLQNVKQKLPLKTNCVKFLFGKISIKNHILLWHLICYMSLRSIIKLKYTWILKILEATQYHPNMSILFSKTRYSNYWWRKLATKVKDKEMGGKEMSPI